MMTHQNSSIIFSKFQLSLKLWSELTKVWKRVLQLIFFLKFQKVCTREVGTEECFFPISWFKMAKRLNTYSKNWWDGSKDFLVFLKTSHVTTLFLAFEVEIKQKSIKIIWNVLVFDHQNRDLIRNLQKIQSLRIASQCLKWKSRKCRRSSSEEKF